MCAVQESIDSLKEQQRRNTSVESSIQEEQSKPQITTYYAKMLDSVDPLGFKIANLKSTDEGCAFKITIFDNQKGNYEIVHDVATQQEMLAAFNPLISDSSTFDYVPPNPNSISVIQAGTVVIENQVIKIVDKQIINIC